MALSPAPLAPAAAAGPGPWVGGHAFTHFGLGAVFAHSVFGPAALPFAIVGAAAAAAQSADQYAAPPTVYYPSRPAYYPPAARYYYAPPRG